MCTNPNLAINLGVDAETGKQIIKFKRPRIGYSLQDYFDMYGKEHVMLMSCGSCLECRMKYRKEWALRCAAEALSYGDNNLFITLTYDESRCPSKLIKRDLNLFWHKLYKTGAKFRYFACGEYGSKTGRPHFHAIIFGYRPSDLKFRFKNSDGFACFSSEIISNCWKNGMIQINNFSPESAAYVAGYVNKKVGTDDGFIVMSRKPGIGYCFYEENKLDLYKYDNFILKGVHNLPRYFMKLLEKDGFDLARLKEARKDIAFDMLQHEFHQHSFEHLESVFSNRRVALHNKLTNSMRRSL